MAIAAARRAGLPLVLAGPVSDAAYFERAIAPSLSEHVRYAGHLNQDELSRLLGRSAVALITPMWDEPYGLVVAEAMSCGTPVVAFACGGIPEIVSPQSGRLVPPNDVDAMADEIAAARSLPRIGIHRHAVGCCSAEAMVTAYLDLYRTTIDDRNEKTHDRLLRPPPRLRSPQSGHQHLRSTSPSGGCVDVAGHPETASVRHRPRASA
jgi:glycosyltransferase involved in cell wall biosynthesis